MADDLFQRLKDTVVFIRSPDGSTGSGYLVAAQRIGTAEHVVRSWLPDRPVEVTIGWGANRRVCKARLAKVDKVNDAAVLSLDDPLDREPLPIAAGVVRKTAWDGYGFPALAGGAGLPIDGHVQDPSTLNDAGQAAVLLYSDAIAAGSASPLHGFSGSPVVVAGGLAGHLVKHIGDIDDRRRAAFGYVYACPIEAVLALLDVPPGQRSDALPAPLPTFSESIPAIGDEEYHVFVSYRSSDRPWALSLVARLEGAGLRVFIDQRELAIGEYLAGQLESALARSRAAVLLVSQGWLASPWCQQEANVLTKRAVEDKRFKLIPLRLDSSEMPPMLDARVWVDFNGTPRAEGPQLERVLNTLVSRQRPKANSAEGKADKADRQLTDELVDAAQRAASGQSGTVAEVQALWKDTGSEDAAPLIAAAETLASRNKFKEALKALQGAPRTLRVRQLEAFALRKSGQIEKGTQLLEGLKAEGHLDPETAGLLAGSYKARWQTNGDGAYKELSYQTYREAYERVGDSFTGINAAAMALQCGDTAKSREFARQVLEVLRARDDGKLTHWELASIGEAHLLLQEMDEARAAYRRAVAMAAGRHQDIAVMRRQARLNLRALGQPQDQLDSALPVPRVLAYFGHMVDAPGRTPPRFPPGKTVGKVRNAIRQRLDRHGALHGFGCAARGTDLLFLEALVERKLTASVVLPFPVDDFVAISVAGVGDWKERFETVRSADNGIEFCDPIYPTCPDAAAQPAAFAKANKEILHQARDYAGRLQETPLVIAVWDGQPGDGPGGTAEAVELWEAEGFDVDVIDILAL